MISVALTLLSALLYTLSFPSWHYRPLAWIALVPFFIAISSTTPRRATGLGFLWALGAAYGITDWLPPAVANYYQQPLWLGVLLFGGATISMIAVHFAWFGLASSWIAKSNLRGKPLFIAAAWVTAELARSRLITGNPWGLIGYSQTHLAATDTDGYGEIASRIIQISEIGGVYLVSFVIVAVNAAVAGVYLSGRLRRLTAPDQTASGKDVCSLRARGWGWTWGVGPVAALVLAAMIWGHFRLATSFFEARKLKNIAIVQGNLDLGFRWKTSMYGQNLRKYMQLTLETKASKPATVFWPETAMTFFVQRDDGFRDSIVQILEEIKSELLAGGPRYVERDNEYFDYYNSAFVIRSDGQISGIYDKEQLLPFAEYFPFGSIHQLDRDFGRTRVFTPGTHFKPLPTEVGEAAVVICNEAMFPRLVRKRILRGAEYIVNLSNDGWMKSREFAEHQLAIAGMRAVESRRYLVRASTSGPSAIVDPHGRIIDRTPTESRAVLNGQVAPATHATIYTRFGDWFAFACLGVLALLAFRNKST